MKKPSSSVSGSRRDRQGGDVESDRLDQYEVEEYSSSFSEAFNGYEVSELTPSQVPAVSSRTNNRLAKKQGATTPSTPAVEGQKQMNEKLLTPAEASDLLGVSRETLRYWRKTDYGPPVTKSEERKIRYPEGPLKAWIRRHTLFPEEPNDSAEQASEVGPRVA